MNIERHTGPDEDRDIAALLRVVGSRPCASAAAMAAARVAVEAEWRDTVAARQRRRQFTGWAMAASVAVAAVAVWLVRPLVQPEAQAVATLARVVGGVEQNRGDGRWTPLGVAGEIEPGTQLRTTGGGRAALRMANGVELRLDARTVVALADAGHATLQGGAVYVDSGATGGGRGPDFVLDTPAGNVRHLGTQYEARYANGELQVGVREGRVEVQRDSGSLVADAGERVTLAGSEVTRTALPPNAADWNWVAGVTPPFTIEGRSVEDFLVWAARETGRTIVYASSEAAQQSRSVTLRGTVEGLTPDEAVHAVLSTTSLQPQIGPDRIRVEASAR
jgi:ferric-dicitrate binding protein FerR (iron transport regulator)